MHGQSLRKKPKPIVPYIYLRNDDDVRPDAAILTSSYLRGKLPTVFFMNSLKSDPPCSGTLLRSDSTCSKTSLRSNLPFSDLSNLIKLDLLLSDHTKTDAEPVGEFL